MYRRILMRALILLLLASWLPAHGQLHVHSDNAPHAHEELAAPSSADAILQEPSFEEAEHAEAACCHGDKEACCGGAHCSGLVTGSLSPLATFGSVQVPALSHPMALITPSRLDRPPRG